MESNQSKTYRLCRSYDCMPSTSSSGELVFMPGVHLFLASLLAGMPLFSHSLAGSLNDVTSRFNVRPDMASFYASGCRLLPWGSTPELLCRARRPSLPHRGWHHVRKRLYRLTRLNPAASSEGGKGGQGQRC
jgi:hypothetical protein